MNRKHVFVLGAGVLVSSLALAGCGAGGAPQQSQQPPQEDQVVSTTDPATGPVDEVSWMLPAEPGTLDPDAGAGAVEGTVLANMCERLYEIQPDYAVEPYLVESAEVQGDTTIVYTLRDDVTFHSGRPMTAEDVVWSLERHAAPGADESDELAGVESIEATGEYEVTITLAAADAQFNMRVAGDAGIIFDREVIEAAGDDFGTPAAPDACSGPYTLSEWNAGSDLVIEAAPDYWNTERTVNTQRVNFTWGDSSAVVNALSSGDTEGAYLSSPALAAPLTANSALTVTYGITTAVWHLFPAGEDGALGSPEIREALSLAIDRQGIANAAFGGAAEPWSAPVAPGTWSLAEDVYQGAYDEITNAPATPSEENLAQARELVANAGDPGEIVIAIDGSEAQTVMANAIRDGGEEVGLTVTIQSLSEAQYAEVYAAEEAREGIDGFIYNWGLNKPEALGMYDNYLPGASTNYINYDDPQYLELYNEASAQYDDVQRAELAVQVQRLYTDNLLSIPLIYTPQTMVTSADLTGAPPGRPYSVYPWAADLGAAG